MLPCYSVTLLLSYRLYLHIPSLFCLVPCCSVTLLLCYLVTLLSCFLVTLLPCYLVTLLICYLVTMLPCYSVTLSLRYLVTLLPCNLVTLGRCFGSNIRSWLNGLHYEYRPSFGVIISNQLSSANFFSYDFLLTEIKEKFLFLRTALGPWRRLSVSILWQLKPVIVSFGFHTFMMIFQKIVNDIQRFTKTEYFPISLFPSQFSNLSELSWRYFYNQIFFIKDWVSRRPCKMT